MPEVQIDIGGTALNVCDGGQRRGPSLLLLNPARANLRVWTPMLSVLEPRFRVIRHDHRGSGRSAPPTDGVYEIDAYAEDAAGVLEVLDASPAVVVGGGFSARTALALAVRRPELVSALVLFDATVFPPVSRDAAEAGERAAAEARRSLGLPEPALDPAWFEHDDPARAIASLGAIFRQPDQSAALKDVASPTLIACGRHDPNWEASLFMSERIANCTFRPIEGAGHGSLVQRPEAAAALIVAFASKAA